MKITLDGHSLKIEREPGDPRYKRGYALPESTLLYHVKEYLNSLGCELIKKRMWRDGHLMGDESMQYLRPRSSKKGLQIYVFNNNYAIYDAAEKLMELGRVWLEIVEVEEGSLDKLREMLETGMIALPKIRV